MQAVGVDAPPVPGASLHPTNGLLWFVVVATLALAACRREAVPTKDALQEAFREKGLTTLEARGHRVFRERCATCHGPEGRGDGQNAYNLDPPPPDFSESLARLPVADRRTVVESGTSALGRSPLCPPRGRSLAPEDADALLAWLEVAARATASPGSPTARRWRRP